MKFTFGAISLFGVGGVLMPPPLDFSKNPELVMWWLIIVSAALGFAVLAILWALRTYIKGINDDRRDMWGEINLAKEKGAQALDEVHNVQAANKAKNESPLCPVTNPDRFYSEMKRVVRCVFVEEKARFKRDLGDSQ